MPCVAQGASPAAMAAGGRLLRSAWLVSMSRQRRQPAPGYRGKSSARQAMRTCLGCCLQGCLPRKACRACGLSALSLARSGTPSGACAWTQRFAMGIFFSRYHLATFVVVADRYTGTHEGRVAGKEKKTGYTAGLHVFAHR